MRVLQVIPYFWPAIKFGGPVKVVYEMCEELAKNHNLTVFTSEAMVAESRVEDMLKSRNFKVFYFRNLINSIAFRYRIYTNFGIVYAYFRKRDYFDIVHIHDVFSIPQIFLTICARLFGKQYLVSTHGVDIAGNKQKGFMKRLMYKVFVESMLKNAGKILATSKEEAALLKKLGFVNLEVVYNGISEDKVKPTNKFGDTIENDTFTLLYVGRINKLKGLQYVVEAMHRSEFPIQLLVAGPDDGYRKTLKNKIDSLGLESKVHFLGLVGEPEKKELYGISDLFVYPSRLEGFSISILEAMNSSLPVLITEACNFPDVSKHKAGVVVSGENIENGIADNLKILNKNDNLLKSMSKNARKLIRQKYSIEKMVEQVEHVYEDIT